MWDQPGIHDVYRRWRQITDEYARPGEDADRILCAEAWVKPADALARYVRGDEIHQSFNFEFLMTPWRRGPAAHHHRDARRRRGRRSTADLGAVQPRRRPSCEPAGVRAVAGLTPPRGIGADDPQPDAAAWPAARPRGHHRHARRCPVRPTSTRARSWASRMRPGCPTTSARTRRGSARPHPARPGRLPGADAVGGQHPVARLRSGRGEPGCRSRPSTALSPSTASGASRARPSSCTAGCSRSGASCASGRGSLTWYDAGSDDVLAFTISAADGRAVLVLANLGASPSRLPDGARVLVSSSPDVSERPRRADRHCGLGGDRSTGLTVLLRVAPLRQYVHVT